MEKASDREVLMDTVDTFWPPGPDGPTRVWQHVASLITAIEAVQGQSLEDAQGYLYFTLDAVGRALGLWDEQVIAAAEADPGHRLHQILLHSPVFEIPLSDGITVPVITLEDVLRGPVWYSACAPAVEWCTFFRKEVLPALVIWGWYDPIREHQPPVGQEWVAFETKAMYRDWLNGLQPGWGDRLCVPPPLTFADIMWEITQSLFKEGM